MAFPVLLERYCMKQIKPDYYDRFHCIAADCPDSCCKDWEVDVDAASAERYRSLPGALGDRLRQVMYTSDGMTSMRIENGRCPMWRQDGLCRIQAELGHDALCEVCQTFPRLRHDYGDFVELGLELSCPEAARLILESDTQIRVEEIPGGEEPEYDTEVMAVLLKSRQTLLQFLKTPNCTVPQALAVMLLYGHSVQAELDGGEAAVLDPAESLKDAYRFAKPANWQSIFDFFLGLEILTSQWKNRLEQGPGKPVWQAKVLRLAKYYVNRYWLQAVSDYDLICRVKLAVIACLMAATMGGDFVETAQQFSKEIENALDNVEAILDGAYTSPAFTDVQLLGLLLCEE